MDFATALASSSQNGTRAETVPLPVLVRRYLDLCRAILGGARLYGSEEFWFAIIKVLTISGLIVLGFVSP